jgi:hypothetical protein
MPYAVKLSLLSAWYAASSVTAFYWFSDLSLPGSPDCRPGDGYCDGPNGPLDVSAADAVGS